MTEIVPAGSPAEVMAAELALVQGDLSKLTPQQRLAYYRAVCESVGLNPFTQPFAYITLNGKLRLYALKDCTDQLRAIKNVSVELTEKRFEEGLYLVTARAQMANGRRDESTGAVTIDSLKGENRANAIMKAETKAKRRVTLSICGLGMLDESEAETTAGRFVPVDPNTGEISAPHQPVQAAEDAVSEQIGVYLRHGSTPPTSGDGKQAFGYVPQRWPIPKMFSEPATESQAKMTRAKARERMLDLDEIDVVRRLVLDAYGLSDDGSKATMSLFIDWLMNADDETLDRASAAVEAEPRPELELS